MLALYSLPVNNTELTPSQEQDTNSLSTNACSGVNDSHPNSIRNYREATSSESLEFQYLRDALTVCFVCDLPPEQAIQEFRDEYGRSPSPRLIDKWIQCDHWQEPELGINAQSVTEWLTRVNRLGWLERLGGEL